MNRKEKRIKKKELNILQEVINVIYQYFPELINKFERLTHLRNQSYVKYQMKVIFMVRLMGLMCEIKTMNELTRELNTEESIENIAQICGLELEEIPHCDTIVVDGTGLATSRKKYNKNCLVKIRPIRTEKNIKNIVHMY